jgi:hypothetical protein
MGILWVLLYHQGEVFYGSVVLLNHLEGLRSLVDVSDVAGNHLDALYNEYV